MIQKQKAQTMNSKNLDAIKSMKTRLHSILETEKLSKMDAYEILCAEESLQEVIERNDPIKNDTSQIRTD